MAAGLGFKTFATGDVLTATDTNGYLMQGVLVFASAAARDSAITSPQEGQFAYLKDTDATTYYTGSAWASVGGASANEALGYKWNMWNPTNNTGTETNAPSSGTSSGNTTNISLANSSGTVTLTLGAGTYLVSTSSNAIITAAYTYAALLNYVGGTATSYLATKASPNNYISQWGEGDQSGDFALSTSFIATATAGQTLTFLPKGRTSGAGTTDKYEYYATLTIVKM